MIGDVATDPARLLTNDRNFPIAYLSTSVDGASLMHKVLRYLTFKEHLNLFQTCNAFRQILAQTGPATACLLYYNLVDVTDLAKTMNRTGHDRVRNLGQWMDPEIEDLLWNAGNDREREMERYMHIRDRRVREVKKAAIRSLVPLMSINTYVAAAFLTLTPSSCSTLFETLCKEPKAGPGRHDDPKRSLLLWECSDAKDPNEAEDSINGDGNGNLVGSGRDESMANRNSLRALADVRNGSDETSDVNGSSSTDNGVDQLCATGINKLCNHHRRWFQKVFRNIFNYQCYLKYSVESNWQDEDVRMLVKISSHVQDTSRLALNLLPKLEHSGYLTPELSPLPRAFDFFPTPNYKNRPGTPLLISQPVKPVGEKCLSELLRMAIDRGWDPLLDHMLLCYRLGEKRSFDLFEHACKTGRVELAMRILEVYGDLVNTTGEHNKILCTAVEKGSEEMVAFLVWIGRRGTENVAADGTVTPPWLAQIETKLREAATDSVSKPSTLCITDTGIRAAALHGHTIDPLHPESRPVRRAVVNRHQSILSVLVNAAGGWRALSRVDGGSTFNRPFVHHDMPFPGSNHVPRGLEDLLMLACSKGCPDMAKFLAAKIRASHRADSGTTDVDIANDPTALLVTTLSECLVMACDRSDHTDAYEICTTLLSDTGDDGGPPPSRPLVADPSLREWQAVRKAVERGHDGVVSLILASLRLPTSVLNPALFVRTLSECLVMACDLTDHTAAYKICTTLLSDTGDDGGPPPSRPLVADPSLRDWQAVRTTVERGHDGVVSLILAGLRLATSVLNLALFVTTLFKCLVMGCDLTDHTAAYKICTTLLSDTGYDGGPPLSLPLVADPSFRNGQAFLTAVERGHEDVVTLLLTDSRLPASVLYPGLAVACHRGYTGVVAQLLARPEVDPHVAAANIPGGSGKVQAVLLIPGGYPNVHTALSADVGCGNFGDVKAASLHPLLKSAILGGHAEVTGLLLSDPRIDPLGEGGMALKLACASGNPEVVLRVIGSQGYVRALGGRVGPEGVVGKATLTAMQCSGLLELLTRFVIKTVIEFRTKATEKEEGGQGRDNEAAEERKWLEIFKRFLAIPVMITAMKNAMLRAAVQNEWVEAVKLLMEYAGHDPAAPLSVDPSDENNEAIRFAAKASDVAKGAAMAKLLLTDPRVDPAVKNSEPFRVAAAQGNVELLKMLVHGGAKKGKVNPNANWGEALVEAVRGDHVEAVRYLLQDVLGLHADMEDGAALQLACRLGHVECVRLLIRRLDVNPGARESKALIDAAENGHVEIVLILIEYMVEQAEGQGLVVHRAVDLGDRNYKVLWTALESACVKNRWDVVSVFAKEVGLDAGNCPSLMRIAIRNDCVKEFIDAVC
ncbi:hypothetical protein HDU96_004451 [Phlyctochytrium bullatum]|nr:hypothetical protein HDU96_004451 [Phlyctochytrium bullatum]